MSIRIDLCTEIPATPEAVWAAIEDVRTHTRWMADARRITVLGEKRQGVGTEFECLTMVGPLRMTDRMRVTEWEPARAMAIEHRGAVTGWGRFRLHPAAQGTRFCWREDVSFPWWLGGRLGELAGKRVLTRVWRKNLERLRTHVVEVSGPRSSPSPGPAPESS